MHMVALWGEGRQAVGGGGESGGDNSFRWTLGWGLWGHGMGDGYILAGGHWRGPRVGWEMGSE
jgi:hypothetical protein